MCRTSVILCTAFCVLSAASIGSGAFLGVPCNGIGDSIKRITLTPSLLIIDLVLRDSTGINSPLVGIAVGVTLIEPDGVDNFTAVTPAGISAGWTAAAENYILTPDNSWREQIEYGDVPPGIHGLWGPDQLPNTGDEPVPTGDIYQFGLLKEQSGIPAGTNGEVSADGQSISHSLVGGYPIGGVPGNDLEGFAPQVGAVLARFVFTNNHGLQESSLVGDYEIWFHKDGMNNGVPDYGPNGAYGRVGPQLLTQDSVNPYLAYDLPEPATLALVGVGLGGLFVRRRR